MNHLSPRQLRALTAGLLLALFAVFLVIRLFVTPADEAKRISEMWALVLVFVGPALVAAYQRLGRPSPPGRRRGRRSHR